MVIAYNYLSAHLGAYTYLDVTVVLFFSVLILPAFLKLVLCMPAVIWYLSELAL
jgi:hypothetical protein